MSYLSLPSLDLADVEKGVISLWFRLSQDSVDKAAEYRYESPDPEAPDVLSRTMPLITFGRKVTNNVYVRIVKKYTFTVPAPGAGTLTASHPYSTNEVKEQYPCEPSYIGIIMSEGSEEGAPPIVQLVMKFQTETRAEVNGLSAQITNVTWSLDPAGGDYNMHRTIEDNSYLMVSEPESFLIVPRFKVDVDQWHHLLVSFDFTTEVDVVSVEGTAADEEELRRKTIKNFCKVWLAFDDENKSGKDNIGDNTGLGVDSEQTPAGWVPMDVNGIIPQNAEAAVTTYIKHEPAKDSAGKPLDIDKTTSNGEYHWKASPLPTQGGQMGLPASADYEETVYHCEMAEFQFFSGVTLDTNIENNRRAFIDAEGKPVSPSKSSEHGPPGSIELLGQRPDIMLRGSGNWKNGKNTGSTGTDDDGEKISTGQFEPTALIATYKPNPSLHG